MSFSLSIAFLTALTSFLVIKSTQEGLSAAGAVGGNGSDLGSLGSFLPLSNGDLDFIHLIH